MTENDTLWLRWAQTHTLVPYDLEKDGFKSGHFIPIDGTTYEVVWVAEEVDPLGEPIDEPLEEEREVTATGTSVIQSLAPSYDECVQGLRRLGYHIRLQRPHEKVAYYVSPLACEKCAESLPCEIDQEARA